MISNEIREALQRVSEILNKHDVDYMIVGGAAVGYYGYQRLSTISVGKAEVTTDLDFWYRPTLNNFIKLTQALIELGVPEEKLNTIVFDPKKTFLKIPHNTFHTDFLCRLDGLDSYQECKKNAETLELDGNKLSVIGYQDLLANKRAVNRKADQNDIDEPEKRRKKQ
jgi:predicted nucleotidyltransferase